MDIKIDFTKSINENAGLYFDKAKKIKKKIGGARNTIEEYGKKLKQIEKKELRLKEQKIEKIKRKEFWYEKFHWFFTSEGFLAIGGKDSTTNEIIVKKYCDDDDLVFHTDMSGSPFFVIKKHYNYNNLGEEKIKDMKEIRNDSKEETAYITACFSRAWKLGMSVIDAFYVNQGQLTKTPQSGQYIQKGSFVVNGKVNNIKVIITDFCLGLERHNESFYRIIVGPEESVKKYSIIYFKLQQGTKKRSDIAKEIISIIKKKKEVDIDNDEIIKNLPGEAKINEIIDIERIRKLE